MSRALAYIAGPYAAATAEEIRQNVDRAVVVGRVALHQGRLPIVPHAAGFLGLFGPGDESHPAERALALGHGRGLAGIVGSMDGELWVLTRDDGSLSSGTMEELQAYLDKVNAPRLRFGDWDFWSKEVR